MVVGSTMTTAGLQSALLALNSGPPALASDWTVGHVEVFHPFDYPRSFFAHPW
jgi:hypothetical protein